MGMKQWLSVGVILGSSFALLSPAMAQQADGRGAKREDRAAKHEQRRQKMTEARGKILRENVGLSEAKAKQVEAAFAKHDKTKWDNHKQVRDAHKRLKSLVESGSATDAQYKAILAELRTSYQAMHTLRQKQFDEVASVLSPSEQAKMVVAMGEMKRRYHHKRGGWHGKHTAKSARDGSGRPGSKHGAESSR